MGEKDLLVNKPCFNEEVLKVGMAIHYSYPNTCCEGNALITRVTPLSISLIEWVEGDKSTYDFDITTKDVWDNKVKIKILK